MALLAVNRAGVAFVGPSRVAEIASGHTMEGAANVDIDRVGSHIGGSLYKGSPTKPVELVDEFNGAYQLEVRPKLAVSVWPLAAL